MRRLLPFLLIVFVFLSFGAAADERGFFQWLDQFFEKKHYSTNDDIRHVRIAGVDLWIPRNYKMGSYNDSNIDQRNVLLQLLLPDFEPRTEKNIKGFTEGTGFGDRLRILLDDFSQTADINLRYEKRLEVSGPFEPIENLYGFDETFKSSDPDGYGVIQAAEFYVKKNENGIQTYVACRIGRRVADQGCQHLFVYSSILLKISYSSRYLPDWKKLETQAIALIETLKTKPLEGQPI